MELTEQRAGRIMTLLRRYDELAPIAFSDGLLEGQHDNVLPVELLGRRLRPNFSEFAEIHRLAERIRRRELRDISSRLRQLGVDVTEVEEATDGQA